MRTFIAVDLPDAMQAALERFQSRLRAAVPAEPLRWVAIGKTHLTLRFLGESGDAQVAHMATVLPEIGARHAGFPLHLDRLGAFPTVRRPRVLWVGVGGGLEELLTLQRAVEEMCRGAGFTPETRPFAPHITLARADRQASGADLAAVGQRFFAPREAWLQPAEGRSFAIHSISLIRSHLDPAGARYELLTRVPLGSGAG